LSISSTRAYFHKYCVAMKYRWICTFFYFELKSIFKSIIYILDIGLKRKMANACTCSFLYHCTIHSGEKKGLDMALLLKFTVLQQVCQLVYWCEVWSAVCCVLVTSRFQSPPLDSPAMGEKEAECICLPCQYIASQ